MPRRLLSAFAFLLFASSAWATEIRIAFPKGLADDSFLKAFTDNRILATAGLTVALKPLENDAETISALKKGDADFGLVILDDEDRRALQSTGAEATLLTRPFMFKSAQEVFLMRDSFLGATAEAGAARSGLFPLKMWSHSVVYILSREPIHSQADFNRLTVASDGGAPNAKVLSAVGAKTMEAAPAEAMASIGRNGGNALETRLGEHTRDYAAKFAGKLYLTTGWPETGTLLAAPAFWSQRREIEKNAIKSAAEQARAAADSELAAREQAFAKLPNVVVNHLDSGEQMHLAMQAGGGGQAAMSQEMELWRKAEVEVHGQLSSAKPAPHAKMAALSPVFFATDRNDERTNNLATRFGSRRLEPYEMTCGYLGSPARHSGEPVLPASPLSITRGASDCAEEIVARTRKAGMKKILFVIHGFNTTFESLAWRALQLGGDLDYDGAIIGWSWPSEGSAFAYAYDEDSNAWSEPHFVDLVEAVAEAAPEMQLDFVAHSMGNRILLQTLRDFALARAKIRIGAAVFAAPDVAQDVFRQQIRLARKVGALRTLYASEYDRAILISQSYHGAPRAGSGGADILVASGIESIDARLGGHSYVFDEPKAMIDFRQIINRETAAAQRGLAERAKAGEAYWVIEP
jgi:esterase/lipase superfamily enzyme/TRAP-type C4-dicarboxylate transport system substrate-binding protein